MHYDLTPEALADAHERFIPEFGLNIVGGCCGTTPEHLRAVVERIGTRAPSPRTIEFEPACSSIFSPVTFHQDLAYLAVGERTNANGSKASSATRCSTPTGTRACRSAREQVKDGAHVLDVCVDYVGRDGVADMDEIASRFATQAALPLVFDSTEPPVMEAGLRHSGGKAILNSANLEEGEEPGKRFDRVMSLAREYGAAVICLAIDEEGQARTADWKVEVCRRIHDLATERYGVDPTDLIFDCAHVPARLGSGGPPPRRHRDHRGDPPHQGRAAGREHHPRRVERELRVQARDPPRAQQRVPARVPRGRPRRRHRARGAHHADAQDRRPRARGHPRPDLRPPPRRLRPAHRAHGAVRRRRRRRGRARGPLGRGRSRSGSSTASSTATATASKPTSRSSWRRCPRSPSSTTCCSTA